MDDPSGVARVCVPVLPSETPFLFHYYSFRTYLSSEDIWLYRDVQPHRWKYGKEIIF